MPKYLHPDRPADATEVVQRLEKLLQLYKDGRWDLIGLTKWFDNDLDLAMDAAVRMEEWVDEQFPDVEGEQHERITTGGYARAVS